MVEQHLKFGVEGPGRQVLVHETTLVTVLQQKSPEVLRSTEIICLPSYVLLFLQQNILLLGLCLHQYITAY